MVEYVNNAHLIARDVVVQDLAVAILEDVRMATSNQKIILPV